MKFDRDNMFTEYLEDNYNTKYLDSDRRRELKKEFDKNWPETLKVLQKGESASDLWQKIRKLVRSPHNRGTVLVDLRTLNTKDLIYVQESVSNVSLADLDDIRRNHIYSTYRALAKYLHDIKSRVDSDLKERQLELKKIKTQLKNWTQEAKNTSSFDTLMDIRNELEKKRKVLNRLHPPVFKEVESEFNNLFKVIEQNNTLANMAGKKWTKFKKNIGDFFGFGRRAQIERIATLHIAKMNPQESIDKISSMHTEAKLFGLMSDHIDMQTMRSVTKRLRSMFRNGQHTVKSYVDRTNTFKYIEVSALGSLAKVEGIFVGPKGGFTYKTLSVNIDGTKTKVKDLDEAISVIYRHFKSKGMY